MKEKKNSYLDPRSLVTSAPIAWFFSQGRKSPRLESMNMGPEMEGPQGTLTTHGSQLCRAWNNASLNKDCEYKYNTENYRHSFLEILRKTKDYKEKSVNNSHSRGP